MGLFQSDATPTERGIPSKVSSFLKNTDASLSAGLDLELLLLRILLLECDKTATSDLAGEESA